MPAKIQRYQIVKLLQMARQPVYLLDADHILVFCNRALAEWTGCDSELLIGQTLRFHTPLSRLRQEIVAAALCPPPEALAGQPHESVLTIDQIVDVSRRRAVFQPLLMDENRFGIIVFVDQEEWSEPETISPPTLERAVVQELHQLLGLWRRQQMECFTEDKAASARLLGHSAVMNTLRRQVRLAAMSTESVLILGEPGTGREHTARSIHFSRPNATFGALIPLDCQVLTTELIGRTIAAFRERYARDSSSRCHTLLLQNAESLSSENIAQIADLLYTSPSNQRIIATSSLSEIDWEKIGRHDLFLLLGTLVLFLPSLRARIAEIPALAQLFLENANKKQSRQFAGFTSETMDLLTMYHWPGNLAELELLVTEAHEQGTSQHPATVTLLTPRDLPDRLHHVAEAQTRPVEPDEVVPLEPFLESVERELLQRALFKARGNKTKAAQLLDITRPRLYRRLEQFGLLDSEESVSNEPS